MNLVRVVRVRVIEVLRRYVHMEYTKKASWTRSVSVSFIHILTVLISRQIVKDYTCRINAMHQDGGCEYFKDVQRTRCTKDSEDS